MATSNGPKNDQLVANGFQGAHRGGLAVSAPLGGPVGLRHGKFKDRLRLGQVDPTAKEGALGKFARLSRTATECKKRAKNRLENEIGSVAVQFYDIFTGISVWGLHIDRKASSRTPALMEVTTVP